MSITDRRRTIKLIALAAIAPAMISRKVQAAKTGGLIAPPSSNMEFERTVVRQLAGGAQITVSRKFEVGFDRFADGFVLEGRQVAVEVIAPESLAAFVKLEEARVEQSMFPIMLDPFGRIASEDPSLSRSQEIDLAFEEFMSRISAQQLDAGQQLELRQLAATLHQAGDMLTSVMPHDLFAPPQGERTESRQIPLPTGDLGLVVSRFDAERDSHTGLMRRALREVFTEIDGDRRQTSEHWQLAAR